MRRSTLALLLMPALYSALVWGVILPSSQPVEARVLQRPYWPVPLDSLALGRALHTHVAVRGVVTLVGHEDDQDMHVRLTSLTGSGRFIIAECIPALPCLTATRLPWLPAIGDTVTVYGISRRDAEHGWWEVHPVEGVGP